MKPELDGRFDEIFFALVLLRFSFHELVVEPEGVVDRGLVRQLDEQPLVEVVGDGLEQRSQTREKTSGAAAGG